MSLSVLTQGCGSSGGASANIIVNGLSESDSVKAVHSSGKTVVGKCTEFSTVAGDIQIPTMTSTTSPSGKVTASSEYGGGWDAVCAFNNNAYGWVPNSSDTETRPYVQYEFENLVIPNKIVITCKGGSVDKVFYYTVEASYDLKTWDVLLDNISLTIPKQSTKSTTNNIETDEPYKAYRLRLSNVDTGSNGHKIQVYGKEILKNNYFTIFPICKYGTWTVEATDGECTTTQDVIVDAATNYEIEMSYDLWLYRYGEENEDVGLTLKANPSYGSGESVKADDYWKFGATSAGKVSGAVLFTNLMDLTPYSKLVLKAKHSADASTSSTVEIAIASTDADEYSQDGSFARVIGKDLPYTSSSEIVEYTLDISSVDHGCVVVNAWASVCYMYELILRR